MTERPEAPRLFLADDAVSRRWSPLVDVRPAGELLLGALTFRRRAERLLRLSVEGHLSTPELAGYEEPDAAPVIQPGDVASDRPRLVLSARAILTRPVGVTLPARSGPVSVGGAPAGWLALAGDPLPDGLGVGPLPPLEGAAPVLELPGDTVEHLWELITRNAEQIRRDFATRLHDHHAFTADVPREATSLGFSPGRLRLGTGIVVEPGVVMDFRGGPIWLDDAVTLRAFTRLAGPAYVGRDSTLLGGSFEAVSIGPACKVRGEMEESVVLGHANKAHDGFLGHAYLGRWVNLGALTTNSDLKNNYGYVRMWTPDGPVDTGQMKLGCVLGDHVKTAIGTMVNTGTVAGVGANLFGGMPPKYVPAFTWGAAADAGPYDIERFLDVAEKAMARRDIPLTEGMRGILRDIFARREG
jgi:hypothetical protein